MKQQIESSLDRLNASLTEYELALPDLSTYAERQFFRDDFLNPMAACILLGTYFTHCACNQCQWTYIFSDVTSSVGTCGAQSLWCQSL